MNTSNVTDQNVTDQNESLAFRVTKVMVYVSIFIASIVGNSAVIAIICRSRSMRIAAGNLLILDLALCDLLTPLLSVPFDMAVEENNNKWLYGAAACKILSPAATLTTTSSSLILAAIALERYRGVMHPFKSRLTPTVVKWTIGGIHTFSLVMVVPYVLVSYIADDDKCGEKWPETDGPPLRQVYTMTLFAVQYVIPLLFMACMYIWTCKSLFKSTRKVRTLSLGSNAAASGAGHRNSTNHSPASPARECFNIRREQNIRITKMFIVVVIIFAVCMLPNQVVWLWIDFGTGEAPSQVARIICRFFTYTNSCLNPIIFCRFSQQFRRGFRSVFLRGFCKKERRKMRRSYNKWRARSSRTSFMTSSTTQTTIESHPPSRQSRISISSVFGKERKKNNNVCSRGETDSLSFQDGLPSARALGKKRKAGVTLDCASSRSIERNSKEVVNDLEKCDDLLDATKAHKLAVIEEHNIEIDLESLGALPGLAETDC